MSQLPIIDVTTLNNYIKNLFEGDINLQRVYIKGEISNLNKHYTGHYYFSLKDDNSKVSCMMFSSYVNKLKYPIENGDEVLIYGKVSVFDKLGTYQIYVYNIEPYGVGKYLLMLEELKKKLKDEGLFDKEKKKINLFPKKIGIVTSKSGAAVKDIIHTISRRYPCQIEIFPCLVQGEDAPKSIIKCLLQADKSDVDTIILARGGGANEDLKAFNDESLVRVAASLKKPLITAIGHQIDSSLVDLVSDISCITPTEAGEKCCMKKIDIINSIDSLNILMDKNIKSYYHNLENKLFQLIYIIENKNPLAILNKHLNKLLQIKDKSNYLIKLKIINYQMEIKNLESRLILLDPRLAFDKGYSLIEKDKKVIKSIKEVAVNEDLTINLKDGIIKAKVKEIKDYGK
ncbi:MAG: exodeoxyribonuclease VII large subunit [Bacilli bacterium]|nr:exodeoxyribonuclease VII large subunit [Bacilli bacterium]